MPWGNKLFKIDKGAKMLDDKRKAILHTFVMKAFFLSKQAKPNITTIISFINSWVKNPNEAD
jgi:hypothetical protein